MCLFPSILASGDDSTGKIVVALIGGIIWAIGSIVSAMNKKSQQARQRQAVEELPIELTPRMEAPQPAAQRRAATLPPPLPPAMPTGPILQSVALPATANVFSRPRRKKQGASAPAVASLRPQAFFVPPAAPVAAPSSVAMPRSRTAAPSAPRVAGLLRPEMLRTQMIIVEVLGKPLALRDDPRRF